jgi:hypothetical protein
LTISLKEEESIKEGRAISDPAFVMRWKKDELLIE